MENPSSRKDSSLRVRFQDFFPGAFLFEGLDFDGGRIDPLPAVLVVHGFIVVQGIWIRTLLCLVGIGSRHATINGMVASKGNRSVDAKVSKVVVCAVRFNVCTADVAVSSLISFVSKARGCAPGVTAGARDVGTVWRQFGWLGRRESGRVSARC